MDEHVLIRYKWKPSGVCAKMFEITILDGKIDHIETTGGCPGNLKAIASLLQGHCVDEAIRKLHGITCGNKGTSCADQLSQALLEKKTNI